MTRARQYVCPNSEWAPSDDRARSRCAIAASTFWALYGQVTLPSLLVMAFICFSQVLPLFQSVSDVGPPTIYAQLRGELRRQLIACLRHGHSTRMARTRGTDRRGQIPDMVSIHVRPPEIEDDCCLGIGKATSSRAQETNRLSPFWSNGPAA